MEPDIRSAESAVQALRERLQLTGWRDIFAIDLRSLAALRIVLALTVLADLALRAPNLRVHYGDDGIVPRPVLLDHLDPWLVSLALSNGTVVFAGLLFAAAAVAAVSLLLGYRTRLATLLVWLLVSAIQWRNPFVGYSADGLLRLLLFWSLFVPLGAVWSLDASRRAAPHWRPERVLSLGTAGLLLQIALMYWVTALLKSGRPWRVDGTALFYPLSIQELATPLGTGLLQSPALLKVLTFLTLGIEAVAPLLFSPVWTGSLRLMGIAAIVGLQAGIWMTLQLGIFPWLGAACMVVFLPSGFWDRLLPRLRAFLPRPSPSPNELGEGRMGAVAMALTTTGVGNALFLHRGGGAVHDESRTGRARLSLEIPTAAHTPSPSRGLGSGDGGEGRPPRWGASYLLNLAAGFCLVYIVVWNLASVSPLALGADARAFGSGLGLVQDWSMFSPYPLNGSSWYVIPGTLRDGRQIDLLPILYGDDPSHVAPVSPDKPRDMRAAYAHDERWRKYFEVLRDPRDTHLLAPLGTWFCREWNAAHAGTPAELETLQITYFWERTLLDNQRAPVQRTVLGNHQCFAELSAS